jgi:hypothetical protein
VKAIKLELYEETGLHAQIDSLLGVSASPYLLSSHSCESRSKPVTVYERLLAERREMEMCTQQYTYVQIMEKLKVGIREFRENLLRTSWRLRYRWPSRATGNDRLLHFGASLLDFPIWTEDQDFFGSGVATWITDRVELYLRAS